MRSSAASGGESTASSCTSFTSNSRKWRSSGRKERTFPPRRLLAPPDCSFRFEASASTYRKEHYLDAVRRVHGRENGVGPRAVLQVRLERDDARPRHHGRHHDLHRDVVHHLPEP